jgi:protease-4
MKNFLKMTLATILGLLIFSVVTMLIGFGIIGAVAAIGEKQATMPAQAVLRLDM